MNTRNPEKSTDAQMTNPRVIETDDGPQEPMPQTAYKQIIAGFCKSSLRWVSLIEIDINSGDNPNTAREIVATIAATEEHGKRTFQVGPLTIMLDRFLMFRSQSPQ